MWGLQYAMDPSCFVWYLLFYNSGHLVPLLSLYRLNGNRWSFELVALEFPQVLCGIPNHCGLRLNFDGVIVRVCAMGHGCWCLFNLPLPTTCLQLPWHFYLYSPCIELSVRWGWLQGQLGVFSWVWMIRRRGKWCAGSWTTLIYSPAMSFFV